MQRACFLNKQQVPDKKLTHASESRETLELHTYHFRVHASQERAVAQRLQLWSQPPQNSRLGNLTVPEPHTVITVCKGRGRGATACFRAGMRRWEAWYIFAETGAVSLGEGATIYVESQSAPDTSPFTFSHSLGRQHLCPGVGA